jgi:hypothetical protein
MFGRLRMTPIHDDGDTAVPDHGAASSGRATRGGGWRITTARQGVMWTSKVRIAVLTAALFMALC